MDVNLTKYIIHVVQGSRRYAVIGIVLVFAQVQSVLKQCIHLQTPLWSLALHDANSKYMYNASPMLEYLAYEFIQALCSRIIYRCSARGVFMM